MSNDKRNSARLYHEMTWAERKKCREQYVDQQGRNCYYCNSSLDADPPQSVVRKRINWKQFPPNFLRYKVHLHHNHKTGVVIGAVHARCNAVLWQYHNE